MTDSLYYLKQFWGKKKYFFYFFFFASFSVLNAQVSKVSGIVTDTNGFTLPGVNVILKDSKIGAVTDFEGNYKIDNLPSDGVLVFTYIGFQTQEVSINGKSKIDVMLLENVSGLDEVVVIGYGTQKKDDVNGAVSSIKASDIENLNQVNVDQMLQGKLSGVTVTNGSGQPGSAVSIRIRGTTSISGTNEPLYVIDGVQISGDATGRSTSGRPIAGNDFSSSGGSGNNAVSPLSMLNPNDIESVDILKDASATAIYGSRGANGVIIITTKSGKKNGNGKIAYNGSTSISHIYKKLDVMNLRQYAQHQNELAVIFGSTPRVEFSHPELLGDGTNWQDEIYQTAISHNHQLSFSGAKEGTNYYVSGSFLNQEANIINSGLKRYTIRLNLDSKVKDWLKVGTNVTAGITNEKLTINQSFTGLIANALLQAPDTPVTNPDGTYGSPPSGQNVAYFNPVAEALTKDNNLVRKNFLGNLYAEASILKGLKYRIELSANTEFSEHTLFEPSYDRGSQSNLTADLYERRQNWYSTILKNLITYDFSVNKHKFTLLAGQEALDSHWEGVIADAHDFKTNDIYGLGLSDPDQRNVNSYKGSSSLWSLFGRLLYDFDDRYSLSASIRQDTSSKFDPSVGNNQTGYFPAVAVGWKLSSESFMEGTKKYIDNIKFKVGYGETGNQQIPNNRYSAILGVQGNSFLPSNFPNPDLKWESMQQTNFGLDFTLFETRLSASLDFYNKTSKDFLFQIPWPAYLTGGESFYGGIDAPYSNIGEMENKGYDITLNYKTINSDNFSWNSTLVFSHYKNNLVSIQDGLSLTQDVNLNGYQQTTVTNTLVDQPIGLFYGYQTDGLFTDMDALNSAPLQFGQTVGTAPGQTYLGDVKYVDVNGDGVIDTKDKTIIGNPHPDFTFGFTNNFRYKNFDLSIFFQGSYGNDILNLTRRAGIANDGLYKNQLVEALNYWTPTNTDTDIPRPIGSDANQNTVMSDRYVEDGSYVRLQNVTLGYNLPSNFLSKYKISRIRLYATAQNLATFTKYTGYDPEVGSFNQNVLLSGIDNGRFPSPRSYSFGLNLEF